MAGLNLGNLTLTIDAETREFEASLKRVQRETTDLKSELDKFQAGKIDLTPQGEKNLKAAIKDSEDLEKQMLASHSAAQKVQINPSLSRDTASAAREADKLGGAFDLAAGRVKAAFAGIAASMGAAQLGKAVMQTGMELESQLNTLGAVSGASAMEIDAVNQKARELGRATDLTSTSAQDAAAAMTELAKGGFTVDQSMDAAKGTLQLAAAAQVDAATAATIQSQALQSFSLSAGDASRVSDILAGAANASSAEMGDVSQALQQAGTVANQFGVSIEDTATAVALFANNGITGSDAGTLLKTALLSLTDQGKPAQKAIRDLGLTVYDAQGKFVGLPTLFDELRTASQSMTPEMYQAATTTLFGSDAARLAGIAAKSGADGFNKLEEAVTRQGQAAEVAAANTRGLPGVMERLQNTWEDALIGIYDEVSDELIAAANAGVDALETLAPIAATVAGDTAEGLGLVGKVAMEAASAFKTLPEPMQDTAGALLALVAANRMFGVDIAGGLVSGVGAAAGALGGFRDDVSAAYLATREARPEIGKMGAGLHVLAGRGGVAASAMNGLKGAAGGFIDFLGGPWAIGIAAAAAVIGESVGAYMRARNANEHYRDAVDSSVETQHAFTQAVIATNGELNKSTLDAATDQVGNYLAGLSAVQERTKGWIWVQPDPEKFDITKQLKANADAWAEMNDDWRPWTDDAWEANIKYTSSFEELVSAQKKLKKHLEDTGQSMDDLNGIVANGGPGLDDLTGYLRGLGTDGATFMADKLQAAHDELEKTAAQAEAMSPSARTAAQAIATIGDEATGADQKLQAFNDLLDSMTGIDKGVQEAMMDASEGIQKVADAATQIDASKGIGAGLFDDAGQLNTQVENARYLHDQLKQIREQMVNVAQAGGDVDQFWADTAAPAFDQLTQSLQLTGDQAEKLREQYSLIPQRVETAVSLNGADPIMQQLGTVYAQLQHLDEGATVNVGALDEGARAYLEDVGVKLTHIEENDTWEITGTANTGDVSNQLSTVISMADDLAGKNIAVSAALDTSQLEGSAEWGLQLLEQLHLEHPTPEAELVIEKLQSGADISMSELALLASQSPTPVADLEKWALDNGIQGAHRALDGLDGQTATSNAEVRDNATGPLQRIKNLLRSITGHHSVEVSSNGGSWGRGFRDGGQVMPLAGGGGYQLPTTGPGTDVVDGFLGIDDGGVPIVRVNRGEFVTESEATRRYLPLLWAINRRDDDQILRYLMARLTGLETGGEVSERVKRDLAPFNGNRYTMGGFSVDSMDCSGAVSAGVNSALELPPLESRMNTTIEGAWLANKGFEPGRGDGDDLVVAWYDNGGGAAGHTAMQLPDGTFIESGGNTGGGLTIGGSAGPLDGRGFTNFMHLPYDDEETAGDEGAVTSMGSSGGKVSPYKSVMRGGDHPAITSAQAQRSLIEGDTPTGAGLMGIGSGSSVVGTGMSMRQMIGGQAAAQVEMLAGDAGFLPEIQGLLDQEIMVNIAMSEHTIAAFKTLDEAREKKQETARNVADAERELAEARKAVGKEAGDQVKEVRKAENAVAKAREGVAEAEKKSGNARAKAVKSANEKLAKAEEKLADVREKAGEKNLKAQENVTQAEKNLQLARADDAAAAAKIVDAQVALVLDTIIAAVETVDKILTRITGQVTGYYTGVAGKAEILSNSMAMLSHNLDLVTKAAENATQAQSNAVKGMEDTLNALKARISAERKTREDTASSYRAVQKAEFDLGMARRVAAETAGTGEINLAELRKQGIFTVTQIMDANKREAVQAVSNVAVAEATLAAARADQMQKAFQNRMASTFAAQELEWAQEDARLEMDKLTAASKALAVAQGNAAGEIGGKKALEKYIAALKKRAEADVLQAEAVSTGVQLKNILPWNWGNIGKAVDKGHEADRKRMEAQAEIDAFHDQAMKELAELGPEAQAEFRKAVSEMEKKGIDAGDFFTGVAGFIAGDDGAMMGAKQRGDMYDATKGLDKLLAESNARIEASTIKAEGELASKEREQKRAELDHRIERLLTEMNAFNTGTQVDDLVEQAKRILAEVTQENEQLKGVNSKLEDKNRSVLMSIGGSGWGSTEGPVRATTGGFGGVTEGDLSVWNTARVESGWLNDAVERALLPGGAGTTNGGIGGLISLPDTVVDGRYRLLEDQRLAGVGPSVGLSTSGVETLRAMLTEVMKRIPSGTRIGTNVAGDVTVNGVETERLLGELGKALTRA